MGQQQSDSRLDEVGVGDGIRDRRDSQRQKVEATLAVGELTVDRYAKDRASIGGDLPPTKSVGESALVLLCCTKLENQVSSQATEAP